MKFATDCANVTEIQHDIEMMANNNALNGIAYIHTIISGIYCQVINYSIPSFRSVYEDRG